MDLRLIALDLDGTTLNSHGKLSPFTKKTLEEAIQRGIQVVIASGRAKSAIPTDILAIEGLNYIITSNGSSIFSLPDFQRIYGMDMSSEVITAVLDVIENCGFPFEAFIAGTAYTSQAYFNSPAAFGVPERMTDYVRRSRISVPSMTDFVRAHCQEIEGIDMIVADTFKKAAIKRQLEQISNLYITSSESYYIELADGSVNKASALQSLAGQLHITPSQILAFGDSGNDMELLTYAGCGVAMKNAAPALLEAADDVTLSNDEDGVAHYLRKLIYS